MINREDLFGESISPDIFKIKKAKRLLQYITSYRSPYLELVETRQENNHNKETIIINLGVERPQKPQIDIRKEELIAIVFHAEDKFAPEVLMLREDFPLTSHLLFMPEGYPRSLCLYEEFYSTIKLTWTPSNFLKQIQDWLKKTALAKLHEEDQALEPLIISTSYNLIITRYFNPDESPFFDISVYEAGNNITLFLRPENHEEKSEFFAIALKLPKTEHGVIRYNPKNLLKLATIFSEINFDLHNELISILNGIYYKENSVDILNKKVLFIFSVPLSRSVSGDIERTDNYAFITDVTLKEIGIAYDIFGEVHDSSIKDAGIVIKPKLRIENTENINLWQVRIQYKIDSNLAASCNNVSSFSNHIVAIGLGALGSQIINNLVRSGFGRWKLIDEDIFLPHNSARHILPSSCSGFFKAGICKEIFNNTIDEALVDEALCLNVLNPNQNEKEKLMKTMSEQDFIFDFSASIAVSRYLANNDTFARTISAYLTPDGKSLVLAAEDNKRFIRLDWLEMLHYREIINNQKLFDSLDNPSYHRYGNSCRDISVQLPQDDFAIWSGFASKKIRELVAESKASLDIFWRNNFDIKHITINISNIHKDNLLSWNVLYDDYILNKMSELREKSLPNETGGVLLGNFDSEHEICYIVDIISPPSDSEELPTSFLRGCEGLCDRVKSIEEKTLGQVRYIGEWHSHPNEHSIVPSVADLLTFEWLKSIMAQDSLPSIMMIIGENKARSIIGAEPIML